MSCPRCVCTPSYDPCENCGTYVMPFDQPREVAALITERAEALIKAREADRKLRGLLKEIEQKTFLGEGI